jgi:predicted Fe-Mo cluster-binding NifX family protein
MQMQIVVTATGADLDVPASPIFGRCPTYVFVDTETMAFEAVENPAVAAAGGAGIQAAQFVVERGAQAVVTGSVGPNASDVFQAAGVPVYLFGGGTVRQAAEAYQAGQLSVSVTAPAPSREEEVADLKDMAGSLRKQLAEVIERLDRLEKGE